AASTCAASSRTRSRTTTLVSTARIFLADVLPNCLFHVNRSVLRGAPQETARDGRPPMCTAPPCGRRSSHLARPTRGPSRAPRQVSCGPRPVPRSAPERSALIEQWPWINLPRYGCPGKQPRNRGCGHLYPHVHHHILDHDRV